MLPERLAFTAELQLSTKHAAPRDRGLTLHLFCLLSLDGVVSNDFSKLHSLIRARILNLPERRKRS
jgi:hypothetical protein